MRLKIKEMRESTGMTQVELCKLAGISRQTLSELENNSDANTTVATLTKIANVLQCNVRDFFVPLTGSILSNQVAIMQPIDTHRG